MRSRSVHRLLPVLGLVMHLWPSVMPAQDTGLTAEFARLSARERSRLAREEAAAALKDTAFQATMARAEVHFQARRYEAAVADFERARALRPLNVYPPVKLDDLRVLIAKRDAAIAQRRADSVARAVPTPDPAPQVSAAPTPPAVPKEVPAAPTPPAVPKEVPTAPVVREVPIEPPVERKARPAPRTDPPVREAPRTVRRQEPVDSMPAAPPPRVPGIQEEQFKEGNAIVLQRTVTTGTEVHVYRKVTHPWGGTYHFLDGLPVDERTWTEQFGDR